MTTPVRSCLSETFGTPCRTTTSSLWKAWPTSCGSSQADRYQLIQIRRFSGAAALRSFRNACMRTRLIALLDTYIVYVTFKPVNTNQSTCKVRAPIHLETYHWCFRPLSFGIQNRASLLYTNICQTPLSEVLLSQNKAVSSSEYIISYIQLEVFFLQSG